jgi:hypothetical protein
VAKPKQSLYERLLALAKTSEERERAFVIAERVEQEQAITAIVAEVRSKAWGDKVGPALQREIVRWALGAGANPVDEVDILAGNPYLNAKYWERLVANEPDFLGIDVPRWIHEDERADADERAERRKLRVMWNVPEEFAASLGLHREQKDLAKGKPAIKVRSAVIVTLRFQARGPFYGVKWCPSSAVDMIGADFPEQTAYTRAIRKAALVAIRRKTPFTERLRAMIDDERHSPPAPREMPLPPEPPSGIQPLAGLEPPSA